MDTGHGRRPARRGRPSELRRHRPPQRSDAVSPTARGAKGLRDPNSPSRADDTGPPIGGYRARSSPGATWPTERAPALQAAQRFDAVHRRCEVPRASVTRTARAERTRPVPRSVDTGHGRRPARRGRPERAPALQRVEDPARRRPAPRRLRSRAARRNGCGCRSPWVGEASRRRRTPSSVRTANRTRGVGVGGPRAGPAPPLRAGPTSRVQFGSGDQHRLGERRHREPTAGATDLVQDVVPLQRQLVRLAQVAIEGAGRGDGGRAGTPARWRGSGRRDGSAAPGVARVGQGSSTTLIDPDPPVGRDPERLGGVRRGAKRWGDQRLRDLSGARGQDRRRGRRIRGAHRRSRTSSPAASGAPSCTRPGPGRRRGPSQ